MFALTHLTGFGGGRSRVTVMPSAESRWLDIDRATFTFSGDDITSTSTSKSMRSLYTFGGLGTTDARDNFPLKYEWTVGAVLHGGRIGFYDLAEEDTFDRNGSGASLNSMTNSWHIQPTGGELWKGGSLVATLGDLRNSVCSFNVAEDGTVTFVQDDVVLHTFAAAVGSTVAIRPMFGNDTASRTVSDISIEFKNRPQADFGTFRLANAASINIGGADGWAGLRFAAPKTGKLLRMQWAHASSTNSENYPAYIHPDSIGTGDPSSPGLFPLEQSSNNESHSVVGSQEFQFAGVTVLDAGINYWAIRPDFTTVVAYSASAGFAGYASGKHNTGVTSISSTGQAPESSSQDWRVRLIMWVEPGDV